MDFDKKTQEFIPRPGEAELLGVDGNKRWPLSNAGELIDLVAGLHERLSTQDLSIYPASSAHMKERVEHARNIQHVLKMTDALKEHVALSEEDFSRLLRPKEDS